jgi:Fe-Mn family superoxide dismutase
MDFGAKAAAYVDAFMRNLRWEGVMRRFKAAAAATSAGLGSSPKAVATGTQWIDVRRAVDFTKALDMVDGATRRDPAQLRAWSSELDRSLPVAVYCVRGQEVSQTAAIALHALGLDAHFVTGGIEACRDAGVAMSLKL